jgi:hypothetical protein
MLKLKKRDGWDELDHTLKEKVCPAGELATILTINPIKKTVTCYSYQIRDGVIFRRLNLSIGWTVRYRGRREFAGGQRQGFFVLFSDFVGPVNTQSENWFVAVIGGPSNQPEEEVCFF